MYYRLSRSAGCWTPTGLAVFVAVAGKQVPDRRILIPVVLSPAALIRLRGSPRPALP
jgi:hypothetical protein